MKKFVNKKIVNKKVKKPMSSEEKNKFYAYLLLAAFAIWTVCSILGTIAFVRTQRDSSSMITAAAEESVSTVDTPSNIPIDEVDVEPYSWLFKLADNASWLVLGSEDSYERSFDPFYGNTGRFDFSHSFRDTFWNLDLSYNYGPCACSFVFDESDKVSIADLSFFLANGNNQVFSDWFNYLYVSYSDGTATTYSFNSIGAESNLILWYPNLRSPNFFRKTITSIAFHFKRTDYFNTSEFYYIPAVSAGAFDTGYSLGYREGYNNGFISRDEEIGVLRNGMLVLGNRNLWYVPETNTTRVFHPLFDTPGHFNVSKTFRELFDTSTVEPQQTSEVTFNFSATHEISNLALNFELDAPSPSGTGDGSSSLDYFENFGTCTVTFSDNMSYLCYPVWDGIMDNVSYGHYDFSNIPLLPQRFITRITFTFLSNTWLKNETFKIIDFNGYYGIGYDTGYDLGYNAALGAFRDELLTEYRKGYTEGEDVGYQTGYNKGYNQGANAAGTYTFDNLLASVVDVNIQAFTSLFDFEILGVNLANFFFSLFSIMLVLAIIRLFL